MARITNKTQKEYQRFNDFLRGELKRRKISQDKAANYLNLSRVSFVKRLSGSVEWSFKEVLEMMDFLEMSITEVL